MRQPNRVAAQRHRPHRQPHLQRYPSATRFGSPLVKRASHQIVQIHVLDVHTQAAAFPAGELEQVVRQPHQPPRVSDQALHQALAEGWIRFGRAALQGFRGGLHRRSERVELVRNI